MATQASARPQSVRFGSSAPLPVHLTALVGRSEEIGEVTALLGTSRLVSLVGAGGSGKSRLASAVAAGLQSRYRDAVGWIDLGALTNPADVDAQVAATLGLREQVDGTSLDALIALIGRSAALLVMDNCEHVIGAATVLIDRLLRGCPSLRILVTSRQALGVAGEKAWLVPPLALPTTGEEATNSDAVQLFVQRAQDVAPTFALTAANTPSVVHICRRLDGLPLAIELAAARIRLLPPEQLAARLDSTLNLLSTNSQLTLPRHRTLRALIDWSYDLLAPDEKRLLARLSVFIGGFTLEAAERVAADDSLSGDQVLDLLAGLVDKSLVTTREWYGEARFRLLETVRQYAREKLEEAGEVEVMRSRHAAFFMEVVETAEPNILGGTRATPWMGRLEHEHGNLRAVADWAAERPDRAETMLRLSTSLHGSTSRLDISRTPGGVCSRPSPTRATFPPVSAEGRWRRRDISPSGSGTTPRSTRRWRQGSSCSAKPALPLIWHSRSTDWPRQRVSRVSSRSPTRSSRRRSRSSATPSSSAGWIFRARFCTPSRTTGGAR